MRNNRLTLWLKSAALVARQFINAARPAKQFSEWESIPSPIRVPGTDTDIPTLLFAEVSKRHRSIAEIGAAGGARILALKHQRPDIEAFAFDIRPEYDETPALVSGVHFIRYRPDIFDKVPGISLVMSVQTLACLAPEPLDDLLATLRRRKIALCFFEPAALVTIDRSIRRKRDTWYHPYDLLAKRHGFKPGLEGGRWKHFVSSKLTERWHYDYWT